MRLGLFETRAIGASRILFGLVWLIDAQFKCPPTASGTGMDRLLNECGEHQSAAILAAAYRRF